MKSKKIKYRQAKAGSDQGSKIGSFGRLNYYSLFAIALISALGAIVYSNSFHCSFHFDDQYFIVDNYAIKNIHDLQAIWRFLPCRFIYYLSIALNYHFFQFDVFSYHLVNLGIHLTSAVLVWWLTLLTLSTPGMKDNSIGRRANIIALLAGLVFVSHPLQTQAVTYIVQRAASMATMFYLASLCFYIKSRLPPHPPEVRWITIPPPGGGMVSGSSKFYYICSLISAVLAMFTKEIAITLPLTFLLYEFCFLKTKGIKWKFLSPFLITLLIIPITMFFTHKESVNSYEIQGAIQGSSGISSMQYLLTQSRVLVTFIRLLFVPLNQNLDYDFSISHSLFEWPTIFSFLILVIIFITAIRLFSKYRLLSFSLFWFFLTLLPESSFFPIKDVIFEHRLYLPMVGYSLFLVSGLYYLFGKNTIKGMVILLIIMIGCNSILTYQRNKIWKDDLSLWDDTVRKSLHKARAHNNRGKVYFDRNDFTQALLDYNKAIELDPDYTGVEAYVNRGYIYYKRNNFIRAMSDYDKAIKMHPFAEAYNDRGIIYDKQGKFDLAISDYNKAIEINPNNYEAYYDRAIIFAKEGNSMKAIFDYNKAIEINPDYSDAYSNRGIIFAQQGNLSQALSDFSRVVELKPADAMAYNNRGSAYFKQGDFDQAISDYTKAIDLDPRQGAYSNRAITYYQLKEYDKAWTDVHKAQELGISVNPGIINSLKRVTGVQ